MDVQMANSRGSLLQYVAGYVAKMSSQFATEWLNDAASCYSIAARVLSEYHPLEPEMILQLAMQWFPQAMTGNALLLHTSCDEPSGVMFLCVSLLGSLLRLPSHRQ